MISKSFYENLMEIANTRRLEVEDIQNAVRIALEKACAADGYKGIIEVSFNDVDKKIRIYERFVVVDTTKEDYEPQRGDLSLEEAKQIKDRVRVGSTFRKELPFDSIGRTGVTRFKQIFTQELHLVEIKRASEYFHANEGEAIVATVENVTDKAVILNVGYNVTSYMPLEDGLQGEEYAKGKNIKVVINKVEDTTKGPRVFVSRSTKEIIKRLFETYVAEVSQGVIDIMSIAREPGNRTKVAVKSNDPNVDAKASCIGVGGSRIKEICSSLNGERIDLFEWKEDPVKLIAEALTPAKCIAVMLDEETRKSVVIVADDQFSLAIGKSGQNVRLASQATSWKIDIKSETQAQEAGIEFIPNVGII